MFMFELIGPPIPQKQTRFIRKSGIAYNPSEKDQAAVQWQIKPYAPTIPFSCPIEMHLTFFLPIPTSCSSKIKAQMLNQVILPIKRPDFDNLAYFITNALKKIVYEDDALITDCIIRKRYSDKPRTVIKVIPIEQMQPLGGILCA